MKLKPKSLSFEEMKQKVDKREDKRVEREKTETVNEKKMRIRWKKENIK